MALSKATHSEKQGMSIMERGSPSFLFIKLKHFGDVLLLTPTLAAVRQSYPDAHIAVLVREGTEKILEGCGLIDQILVTAPAEKKRRKMRHWIDQARLLLKLRERRYDYVFELTDGDRGRWCGAFCKAGLRCASDYGWPAATWWRKPYRGLVSDDWNQCHRVEKDYRLVRHFLRLPAEPPALVFQPPKNLAGCETPAGAYAILHPSSRWKRKLWPLEKWAEVGRHLAGRGLACVISSGPDPQERAFAEALREQIGPAGSCTGGLLAWNQLGVLIQGARLFVGIDTAAMHLAAACQTPIVALFGPSIEHHWRPWRAPHEIVSPTGALHDRYPQFMHDAQERSMQDISAVSVIAACERMLPVPMMEECL
jgi:lipopolysaccharide heptosyltransferase III